MSAAISYGNFVIFCNDKLFAFKGVKIVSNNNNYRKNWDSRNCTLGESHRTSLNINSDVAKVDDCQSLPVVVGFFLFNVFSQ